MENTQAAFDEAIRLGFKALELDLIRLKDGNIVLFHDTTLFRMFQIDERVEDLKLGEFRRIFPELMTFESFHQRYKDLDLCVNFEIKDDPETLHWVRSMIADFKEPVVSSFNWTVVNEALGMGFEAGYLFSSLDQPEADIFPFRNTRLHLPYRGEELAELEGHLRRFPGFDFYFYTVNRRSHLNLLKKIPGLKGVFTDEAGLRRAPLLA